ncbi:hypothetical protein M885DRAFT_588148 [Pelagophyceae sp. CCMP2097]|nr:hypothetical protein M885DRAFT_588148 [Pelagophyceae sp. CCMP2097]
MARACVAALCLARAAGLWSGALPRGGVEVRVADYGDVPGIAACCVESFYGGGGLDVQLPWMLSLGKRLVAVKRGSLSPHCILVAREGSKVLGCCEVGLLPSPPGSFDDEAPQPRAQPSAVNAAWRGVAVDDARAWKCVDVPYLGNVAVLPSARRRRVGSALVERAAAMLAEDETWKRWRLDGARRPPASADALYVRVTDAEAGLFWTRCGFDYLPQDTAGATDARGRGGSWLRRNLVAV